MVNITLSAMATSGEGQEWDQGEVYKMSQLYQLLCSFYLKKYGKMLIFYIEWGTQ